MLTGLTAWRRLAPLIVAFLISATALTSAPALAFDLQITEIWPGNEPGDNLSEDWFEIVNTGSTPWQAGVDGELYYDDESADVTTADPIAGIAAIQPGEAVVVLITDDGGAVQAFVDLWATAYDLTGVQVGSVDGAGLGQGGDAVTLYVGDPDGGGGVEVDYESYPDAEANGGQSYDVDKGAFSEPGDLPYGAVATLFANDAGQPAVGSPGNLGPAAVAGDIPVITLVGEEQIVVTLGADFDDPGATAEDTEDGDLTGAIVVGGDSVDTAMLGIYTLTYDVEDSAGNAAATLSRTVVVTYAESIPAAPLPKLPGLFEHVATLGGLPGAEIPAYDRKSRQAYVTSGDGLQIIDLSDPTNPTLGALLDPVSYGLAASAVTSVDACKGVIAFAVPSEPQTAPGSVVFIEADGTLIRTVSVGALPDMVTFTDDCRKLLTADEGEPAEGVDPPGSVSIVDVKSGNVATADFSRFNGDEDALRARGVRIFPNVLAGNDFEPEYIAISPDGKRAYVTLQEANALAVVHIGSATVLAVLPLGLKDHSLPGNELDASDEDQVVNIASWPLHGMYMPDAIASYGHGKFFEYYITANEGDARNADVRAGALPLDPTAFPPELDLQNEFNLGRIDVSAIDGDIDGDGDYDVLQSYGARSFSIWNRWGQRVFDSGSEIESIIAAQTPDSYDDGRSDNKGPEPEGVEVGKLFGFTLAFIGLERTDQVLVYDVTWPWAPRFLQILENPGDDAPEGLKYLPTFESPNHCPTLLVTNEDSSTLTIYQFALCAAR